MLIASLIRYESVRFGGLLDGVGNHLGGGGEPPTLVINGANANTGRANRLVRGPLIASNCD
jgi:hypothetical protein